MVFCCVPLCGTDSYRSDPSVTFHEFPCNPDLAAKWIKQINSAVRTKQKPMWFPRGRAVVCSKHFLQTDFKDDCDILKPRTIPTVFGHKYIGFSQTTEDNHTVVNGNKKSPFIVKVNRPSSDESDLVISDVYSLSSKLNSSHNETAKTVPPMSPHSEASQNSSPVKNSYVDSFEHKNASVNVNLQNSITNAISPNIKTAIGSNIMKPSVFSQENLQKGNEILRKKGFKKDGPKNELIEIGPNTFLKINPDIIKVNKKLTPTGNTVLQFIMDQKHANQASNLLPKIMKTSEQNNDLMDHISEESNNSEKMSKKEEVVVQQIVGHLIDTHVCEETCDELKDINEEDDDMVVDNEDEESSNKNSDASNCVSITPIQNSNISMTMTSEGLPNNYNSSSNKTTNNYLAKAPVLFTTNLPISHCLTDKSKYAVQFKQKSRQIASLKLKLSTLTKKIEELENKCVVQERQLSYPFIKRLKTIRKNASKGDPCATYILEQIRCYTGKTKMRWSDTTLTQCAIWCRKAPYAYEYFKKADFFKLPCLGTVKRYMKKHPEIRNQNKINPLNPDESESSSDFDFDESDSDKEGQGHSDDENMEPTTTCETMLCDSQVVPSAEQSQMIVSNQIFANSTQIIPNSITPIQQEELIQNDPGSETSKDGEKSIELSSFPMTMDTSNLIQEIILPSGEVMQCYTSSLCNGNDASERYYIIPNVGDPNSGMEQEYNVVQTAESLPVILQNLDNCQLPMQQEQYVFVTNSSEQIEGGPETEVVTASI